MAWRPSRKQLEDIAKPLTAEDADAEGELEVEQLEGEKAAPSGGES